jgi:molybdate transport system ATP-binding protein
VYLQIAKRYPGIYINVEAELGDGCTVFAGASGSGKSTMLKMIAGLVRPDSGLIQGADSMWFHSVRGINLPPDRRRIGFIPQNYLLFPHMTVFQNVAFGLEARKVPPADVRRRVHDMLEICGIERCAGVQPHELSGGQQQRVALARALVTNPTLLLMDEPFSALDVQTGRRIRIAVREILRSLGVRTLLVTHDPVDAVTFSDEVFMMENGEVVQHGSFDQIRAAPRSRFVGEFTGLNAYRAVARRSPGGLEMRLPSGTVLVGVGDQEGEVLALFAPTDVTLSHSSMAGSARNCLPMVVRDVTILPYGHCLVHLHGVMEMTAEISAASLRDLDLEPGVAVCASIKATAIRVVSAEKP